MPDLMFIAEPEWLVVEKSVYRPGAKAMFRSAADRDLVLGADSLKTGVLGALELDQWEKEVAERPYRDRVQEDLLRRSWLGDLYGDRYVWRTINGCIASSDPEEKHQFIPNLVPREWRSGFRVQMRIKYDRPSVTSGGSPTMCTIRWSYLWMDGRCMYSTSRQ